jgi:hypothetical protein
MEESYDGAQAVIRGAKLKAIVAIIGANRCAMTVFMATRGMDDPSASTLTSNSC